MIPTQRPASLTTGTPGSSLVLSSLMTSSILVSSDTRSGSESMTSRTSVAICGWTLVRGEAGGQRVDHVAGDHVVGAADALRRRGTRARVRETTGRGRLERGEPLRQQRAD